MLNLDVKIKVSFESQYHYDIAVLDLKKCGIPHCHTFGLLSHHGSLGGGGRRRKLLLDGALEFLSKICQLSLLC